MNLASFSRLTCVALGCVAVAVCAQAQASAQDIPAGQDGSDTPIFRSGVTLVTTDVIVRDDQGQFIPDLRPEDFVVFEDDARQEVSSLILVHGGRVFDLLAPPSIPVQEGIILPQVQAVDSTAGRIFILFVDDLHLDASLTPKIRQLFKQIGEELVHEGDLFGIVSSGTSSVSTNLTYDRNLLFAAGERIIGDGIKPDDLIQMQQRMGPGLSELRWRAHSAFKTARDLLGGLERITNRRKVFLYISSGYDFDPFGESFRNRGRYGRGLGSGGLTGDPFRQIDRQGQVFSDGELHAELAELAAAANRANTTFHTLDPRGLMAGADTQYNLPAREWQSHVFRTQTSLRTIAELTGGMAIVNRNTFTSGLREIDAETSDYYVLGFYTNSPDLGEERTRLLSVEVNRPGAEVQSREEYTFDWPTAR